MKCSFASLWVVAALTILSCGPVQAERHRATRLGHPATRFAPPLATPEDLRVRFRDVRLRADMISVLRQWGWKGQVDDLFRAALTAPLTDITIPIGTTMPFMSSRENGQPICLRNVLWAGQEPAPAYAFLFTSNGRRYRCVTPKACSNFFVEDLGVEPRVALALSCAAPAEVLAGRPIEICLTIRNTGNAVEPRATVALPIPEGATFARATGNGQGSGTEVTWEITNLAPGAAKQMCAFLAKREPSVLAFHPTAVGTAATPVLSVCSTKVLGIPAILLELVDLEDPIEVGKEVTYEIRVTNQGSAPGTNIRLACRLPVSQEFVSGAGATAVQAQAGIIAMEPLPHLAPKAAALWRVVVKAVHADDARFKLQLTSDQFERSIDEEESTELY